MRWDSGGRSGEGLVKPFAINEVDHEEWQGQWTDWDCQRAPSCFSTWEAILQIANEILDGKDMPHYWRTSTVIPIIRKKVAL